MKVSWGGNEMTDCVALLGLQEKVMLRVLPSPVRVDLIVPVTETTPFPVEIRGNQVSTPGAEDLIVLAYEWSVAVFWRDMLILMAQEMISNETVLLHTDFRPLGMDIFDDAAGLHIGSSVLRGNNFSGCSIGIALS